MTLPPRPAPPSRAEIDQALPPEGPQAPSRRRTHALLARLAFPATASGTAVALEDRLADRLSATEFGLRADLRERAGAAMRQGDDRLDLAGAGFAAEDVGKWAVVEGAGGIGPQRLLVARIRAVLDSRTLRLDAPAARDVDGASLAWMSDNGPALGRALEAAVASGRALYLPSGTYAIDPRTLPILHLGRGQRLVLQGDGASSRLLRLAGSSMASNTGGPKRRLLWLSTEGSGGAELVEIRDLAIDSNARQNPLPDGQGPYALEQNHDISLQAFPADPLELARFESITLIDPLADGINLADTHWHSEGRCVGTALFQGIACLGRTRVRSDIIWYGNVERVIIAGCALDWLESEPEEVPRHPVEVVIADTQTRLLDLGLPARLAAGRGRMRVRASHLVVSEATYLAGIAGRFSQCRFRLTPDWPVALADLTDVTFQGCDFHLPLAPAGGAVHPLRALWRGGATGRVALRDCGFWLDHPDPALRPAGAAIGPGQAVAAQAQDPPVLELEACRFDPRLAASIERAGDGLLRTERCHLAGREVAVRLAAPPGTRLAWESRDDRPVPGPDGTPPRLFALAAPGVGARLELELGDRGIPAAAAGFLAADGALARARITTTRLLLLEEGPPRGGGLAGDRARLRHPLPGAVAEWLCVASDPDAATWLPLPPLAG